MTPTTNERQPSPRELQQRTVSVLARLLLPTNLPVTTWHIHSGESFLRTAEPMDFPMLTGQTDSHAAVRTWAIHFATEIDLAYGTTPTVRIVIDGIGVEVWCAPRYRDNTAVGHSGTASGGEDR